MTDDLQSRVQSALGPGYRIERELGGGGMSRVFLADEQALGRKVVVKVLSPELGAGLNVERFRREIQLAAGLQHPHIVPVLAAGEASGLPYFMMPYVAGDSLRARLRRTGALPIAEVVAIVRDVARGLAFAHERGVVHRDIKPDNVLLAGGSATVTDFGVAKALSSARHAEGGGSLTLVGSSLGTPAYMAPEQAAADPDTDHRADLYALGVVAYELLAGSTPFDGRTPRALLAAQMAEAPPPITERRPDTPPALAGLVMQLLQKDPADRPQTADAVLAALDDPNATRSQPRTIASVPPSSRRRRLLLATAGIAALLIVAAGIVMRRRGAPSAGADAVAVLPFVNSGGDVQDEYFSDGMTDELTSALSQVRGLRVASRTSAYAYKGRRDVDVRQIGRQLGVGAVLEGTIRRDGDRIRLSARLTGTHDGLTVWSEQYERKVADVFKLQDELSSAIVAALAPRLTGKLPARRQTADLEAYDLYLRGRYLWHARGDSALRAAAGLFAQAIQRDPGFADAHAGLADALALLPVYGLTSSDSALPIARREAERAVALDSLNADAYATLGLVAKSAGDWAGAERALRRSLALDPNGAAAHQWYGEVLVITGHPAEGAAQMTIARRLDPLSPIVAAELSFMLALAGDSAAAFREGASAVALAPTLWATHAFLGSAFVFSDRPAAAVSELAQAVTLDSNVTIFTGILGFALGRAGRLDSARTVAARLEARALRHAASPAGVAIAYLGLGDAARALTWFERAVEEKDQFLLAIGVSPGWFDPVRTDPRFVSGARRLGLDPALRAPALTH